MNRNLTSPENPLISIVLPVYNGIRFLDMTLASIEKQSYSPLELVAVDDGSDDGSVDCLREFAEKSTLPVKILRHPQNVRKGIAASYRLAMEHARGSLVSFLEQDDCWPEDKLFQQAQVFQQYPDVGLVFSDVYRMNTGHEPDRTAFRSWLNRPPADKPFDGFSRLLWGNYVTTFSNIMVRRSTMKPGDFIDEPPGYQDWMLLIIISARCKFYYCRSTRVLWRQHPQSFFQQLRRQPGYHTNSRRLRRAALRQSIAIRRNEKASPGGIGTGSNRLFGMFWNIIIFLLDVAENLVSKLRGHYGIQ